MAKRPLYVLTYIRDYDGYESINEYIGSNYKAACARYLELYNYVRQRDFLDENVAEDRIDGNFRTPPTELKPGQSIASYLNDNDCFYITIELSCIMPGAFRISQMEEQYKAHYPNAKY